MRQFYYGWLVVAACTLIFALIVGSTFIAFGLFVLPVSKEFGLSRADANTGLILFNVGNALLAPFVGRLLDRVPARRVMVTSAFLLGGSLASLGLSHSLALDVAIMLVPLSLGVLGAGTITVPVLIARWFTRYRGRAMALAALGLALGGIAVAPLIGLLVAAQGWRAALQITGVVIGCLLLLVTLGVRERPGPDDVEAPGLEPEAGAAAAAGPAPSAASVLSRPLFWALGIGISLGLGVSQALTVSLVPIALESGLSMAQSASIVSIGGLAGIVSMLLLALVADRFDRSLQLVLLIGFGVVPNAMLLASHSYGLLLASSLIIGLASSTASPVYLALLADRFGLAAFGTVRGLILPLTSAISALAIRYIGEVFDRTGSYDLGFWSFIAIDLVAASLILGTWLTRGRSPQPGGELAA